MVKVTGYTYLSLPYFEVLPTVRVTTYHSTLCKIPEERRSQSLKLFCSIHIYSTVWRSVTTDKLVVTQLFKKCLACMEPSSSSLLSEKPASGFCPDSADSSPYFHTLFLEQLILISYSLCFEVPLLPVRFSNFKFSMHTLSHVQPVSS